MVSPKKEVALDRVERFVLWFLAGSWVAEYILIPIIKIAWWLR